MIRAAGRSDEQRRGALQRRAERWPYIWAALVLVTGLTAVGFAVAYAHGSAATRAATAATRCINEVLRERDVLSGELHQADVLRVTRQRAAERIKTAALDDLSKAGDQASATQAFNRYRVGERAFDQTLAQYIATSNKIRAEQLARPLGHC